MEYNTSAPAQKRKKNIALRNGLEIPVFGSL